MDPLPRLAAPALLRRLTVGDLAAFQAYRSDPAVGRYQGWAAMSDAEATAFLCEMQDAELLVPGTWSQIAIAEPTSCALVGDIGLCLARDGGEAEVGFTLSPLARGRGLATAAVRAAIQMVFQQTPAARVVGVTDARNTPSIRLLERLGMRCLASRDAVFRGEACIECVYAIGR